MRRVLITDVETTGLDPASDHVIEVAIVEWSVKHRTIIRAASGLAEHESNPAESVNRIPAAALSDPALDYEPWNFVANMVDDATHFEGSCFVAHRAEFDRSFYLPHIRCRLPWACSKFDIAWPRSAPGASLVEVALAHDVAVAYNHRALADCLLLARIFERVAELGHDVEKLLSDALLPRITLQAFQKFEDNDKAKAAGFRFDGATKRWLKRVRKDQPGEFPFRVREVTA